MRDDLHERLIELYQRPHTGQDPEFEAAFNNELVGLRAKYSIGDRVEKVAGNRWPGVVVAAFITTQNQLRYVVECIAEEVYGSLRIFKEEQLISRARGDDEPADPEE